MRLVDPDMADREATRVVRELTAHAQDTAGRLGFVMSNRRIYEHLTSAVVEHIPDHEFAALVVAKAKEELL